MCFGGRKEGSSARSGESWRGYNLRRGEGGERGEPCGFLRLLEYPHLFLNQIGGGRKRGKFTFSGPVSFALCFFEVTTEGGRKRNRRRTGKADSSLVLWRLLGRGGSDNFLYSIFGLASGKMKGEREGKGASSIRPPSKTALKSLSDSSPSIWRREEKTLLEDVARNFLGLASEAHLPFPT